MANYKHHKRHGSAACGMCKEGKSLGQPRDRERQNSIKKSWIDDIRDAFNANLHKTDKELGIN